MDDLELVAQIRRHLLHTSVLAIARQTGLNRNTIWDALAEKHGINSRTRRALLTWLQGAQVCAAFRQGQSVHDVAQQYHLTTQHVEQILRAWLV